MKIIRILQSALIIAIFLCLSGCGLFRAATHETQDMLNSRMNKMSYEEALQRFGPPAQCAESGSTQVCVWIYGEGGTVTIMPQVPAQRSNPYSVDFGAIVPNMAMTLPVQRPTARLTFTNGVLTWWQLFGNWR
jgi:uncharacterized protein YceK